MKCVYKIGSLWDDVEPEVGKAYILISKEDVLSGSETYYIRPWDPEDGGVPGNLNPEIRYYHGWRGTYNNIATYVHGVREVKEIISIKQDEMGRDVYKIRFTGKDLVEDLD